MTAERKLYTAIYSCVGGGPIERLAKYFSKMHGTMDVVSRFSPEHWRKLMAKNAFSRMWARFEAIFFFPLTALWHAFKRPLDCIIVSTNPFFLPLFMIITKIVHRRPVVVLIYDLIPELYVAGTSVLHKILWLLTSAVYCATLKHADGVVFIGRLIAEHTRKNYREPYVWTVIETGVDIDDFSSRKYQEDGPETELERWSEGKCIVSYVGNMGLSHDWETMARAIPQLIQRWKDTGRLGFVIAASGPGVGCLQKCWKDLPRDMVYFSAPLPDREWTRLLSISDISIVTLKKSSRLTCVPSKNLSAMAAGSAIVAVTPLDSDCAMVVASARCGYIVEPGNVDALVNSIQELVSVPSVMQEYKKNAVRAAHELYAMDKMADKWADFIIRLKDMEQNQSLLKIN